ncbi:methyl-accepting chemotaxis protein [Acuticoccus sp. MNP-M23]|uniref:methyl-accepting chemotaxis protein n=1 Tax=Acuticoccus sp. MNP-M23 TaxID=3072793 RepID=UPI002815E6F2|nr:methyl-accepting chemotaxis protein [Acuticoccus sp. MNP-M23]WMS43289.1 methyl-accepting chemotaxis protein [Acuticoccus sp. MNP-M23]
MKSLSIANKGTLACGAIAVVSIAAFGIVIWTTMLQSQTTERVLQTFRLAIATVEYRDAVDQGHADLLKKMILGETIDEEKVLKSFSESQDQLEGLRTQIVGLDGAADFLAHVDTISALREEWFRDIALLQISDMADPVRVDLARLRENDVRGHEIWDSLAEEMDVLVADARALRENYTASLEWEQRMLLIGGIAGGVIVTILALLVTIFVRRKIAAPLRDHTRVALALRSHDWSVKVPHLDRQDEIGELGQALQTLRDEGRVAQENDAKYRIESEAQIKQAAAVKQASDDFKTTSAVVLEEVESAALALAEAAQSLGLRAGEGHALTTSVAEAATSSGVNMQSVAAAIEEMSISVDEISRQVQSATQLTQQTTQASQAAIKQVSGLLEKSKKINDVIELIDNIAEQINLLALNATIESARAGEAGKGFAVVAQQVKELADQTGSATEEISKVISDVRKEITDVVHAIEGIGTSINAVNDNSSTVAAAVEQQSAAINEISSNVGAVSTQTNSVADNVKGVAKQIGETHTLAESVRGLSSRVKDNGTKMQTEISSFFDAIRNRAA